MQWIFTRLLAGFLALTLLLTAETMAMARGAPVAVGEMVLCTGDGVITVATDAEGNPVAPAHVCPDCLPFFGALHGQRPADGPILTLAPADLTANPARMTPAASILTARARAPPEKL